jgi:transposase-like protein
LESTITQPNNNGIFPNEAACLRLVSAILMEIDDTWQAGRVYLTLDRDELQLQPQ